MLTKYSKEYDEVYEKAQELFDKYNPCEIKREGSKVSCVGGLKQEGNELCCYGCGYLGKNGCTVKALDCKLWLCSVIARRHPIREELKKLKRDMSWELEEVLDLRTTKQKTLGRLKSGSYDK